MELLVQSYTCLTFQGIYCLQHHSEHSPCPMPDVCGGPPQTQEYLGDDDNDSHGSPCHDTSAQPQAPI